MTLTPCESNFPLKIKNLIGPQPDFFQSWPNFLQALWGCANLWGWPSMSCVLDFNILWKKMMPILLFKAGNYGPRTFQANSEVLWHLTVRVQFSNQNVEIILWSRFYLVSKWAIKNIKILKNVGLRKIHLWGIYKKY